MKFKVRRVSDRFGRDPLEEVEISSLEGFMQWVGNQSDEVIVHVDGEDYESEDPVLEIYDSWRE